MSDQSASVGDGPVRLDLSVTADSLDELIDRLRHLADDLIESDTLEQEINDDRVSARLSRPETLVDRTYAWWTGHDGFGDISRQRALAWTETPNARVVAARVGYGTTPPETLLVRLRERIHTAPGLPPWGTPADAETALRAMLEECAD